MPSARYPSVSASWFRPSVLLSALILLTANLCAVGSVDANVPVKDDLQPLTTKGSSEQAYQGRTPQVAAMAEEEEEEEEEAGELPPQEPEEDEAGQDSEPAAEEPAAEEPAAEEPAAEEPAAEEPAAEEPAAAEPAAEEVAAAVRPASGISVYNGTGFHFGEPLNEKGGEGRWFNEGGGIGLLLGPPGSRLLGRVRFAYNAVIDLAGGTRHVAVLSAGVQVELLPDVNKRFGLYVVTDVGITPLFTDMRLYLFADVGPGVRFDVHRRVSLFAEVCALFRYENGFYAGPQFYFGARFALD